MDPQKLASLDPKLREAYQRVMGTVVPKPQDPAQNQTPPPPAPPIPDPVPQLEPQPTPIEPPAQPPVSEPQPIPTPQPSTPQPQPAISPQPEPPVQANNFVQMNSEVAAVPSSPNFSAPASMPQAQTMTIKKKNGMITPILFGIVSLVFIVIYTLFWTKIFNFQLPFLP